LGAVASDFFCEAKLSHVLAVEFGRALRPRDIGKRRAEQEAQPQTSQHSILPVRVSKSRQLTSNFIGLTINSMLKLTFQS
jgi:hypothetical protein